MSENENERKKFLIRYTIPGSLRSIFFLSTNLCGS